MQDETKSDSLSEKRGGGKNGQNEIALRAIASSNKAHSLLFAESNEAFACSGFQQKTFNVSFRWTKRKMTHSDNVSILTAHFQERKKQLTQTTTKKKIPVKKAGFRELRRNIYAYRTNQSDQLIPISETGWEDLL